MIVDINEFDIFFISYDEPNAERHWADLLGKSIRAKRIHNIHGSDAAHKEAAKQSTTDRLITVDADNIVLDKFFKMKMEFNSVYDYENNVFAWSSYNYVNGLSYGNGGIKCWPKKFIEQMKTHEIAETEKDSLDFCWNDNYKHMDEVYSTTYTNGSPLQAFRAGFREGVKMCLDQGVRMNKLEFSDKVYWQNIDRLLIWCNIGVDVDNGLWSILGARIAVNKMLLDKDFDWKQTRDFFWLDNIFKQYEKRPLKATIKALGYPLSNMLHLPMIEPTEQYSKFHKRIYRCPKI